MCVSVLTLSYEEAKVLEALQHDLATPWIVQWNMFWLSAPTNLNRGFLNNGTMNEVVNLALAATFVGMFTSRISSSRSMHVVLSRSLARPKDVNREKKGWGLGGRLVLLLDDGNSDNDLDSDKADLGNVAKWMTPVYFKSDIESFCISGSLEESHDKEKFELAIKRVANKDTLAASSVDDG